jgi:hypothetical protein
MSFYYLGDTCYLDLILIATKLQKYTPITFRYEEDMSFRFGLNDYSRPGTGERINDASGTLG